MTCDHCKAICGPKDQNGNDTFKKNDAGTAYLKTSSVCAVASDAFASDPKVLEEKKFGVVKIVDPLDNKNFFIDDNIILIIFNLYMMRNGLNQ